MAPLAATKLPKSPKIDERASSLGLRSYAVPLLATSVFLGTVLGGPSVPAAHATAVETASQMAMAAEAAPGGVIGFLDDTVGPGFVQAFSLIFISELGDKTFFIAALLSAKFSRAISFVGSVGALTVMTGISVALGQIFHAIPDGLQTGLPIDEYLATLAFAYFGYRTLSEALAMEDDEKGGELEDAEEAMAEAGLGGNNGDQEAAEMGTLERLRKSGAFALVAQTFGLVFAAEFGDRSFLSTIALAAAQNPVSVFTGAVAAHAVATAGAVAGGAILSDYLSEKLIGIIGGTLFFVFAITTAVGLY